MSENEPPLEERFLANVNKTDTCWLWTAGTSSTGYGVLRRVDMDGKRKPVGAHRIAWELRNGPIPDGLHIDHLCRVRNCVNPDHLEPVTLAENNRRAWAARPRITECKWGHKFDSENTSTGDDGRRFCLACGRLRARAYKNGTTFQKLLAESRVA